MGWNTIQSSDVLNEFTPAEQAALSGIQGSDSNLGIILTNAVNAARGSIVAGGNQLGADGTIPDQVRPGVIAIARWKWLSSFPALKALLTDARKDAAKDAQDMLDKIASQSPSRPRIELPPNAITTSAPVGAVGIVRPGTCFNPCSFNKLGST